MSLSSARKDYDDCTAKYGSGKLADGRTYTLDLDELPRPEADSP